MVAGLVTAAVGGCVGLFVLVRVVVLLLLSWAFQAVWNTVLVASFGVQPLGYLLAVCVVFLSSWLVRTVFSTRVVATRQ